MTSVAESKEAEMRKTLVTALNASFVKVEDISGEFPTYSPRNSLKVLCSELLFTVLAGGCGSVYKLEVESPEFVGKTLVNQHKLVTKVSSDQAVCLLQQQKMFDSQLLVSQALKAEIGEMHGLTIQTRRPRND